VPAPAHNLDHLHDRTLGRGAGAVSPLGRLASALAHPRHQQGRIDVARSSQHQ
jgi:hypothetical protein